MFNIKDQAIKFLKNSDYVVSFDRKIVSKLISNIYSFCLKFGHKHNIKLQNCIFVK
jgi:hypothetical protein